MMYRLFQRPCCGFRTFELHIVGTVCGRQLLICVSLDFIYLHRASTVRCRCNTVNFLNSHKRHNRTRRKGEVWGAFCEFNHDDIIKWKHIPRCWPFVREIRRPPGKSPHKGQWLGALMFSLIFAWINDWVKNHWAGNLRRHCANYDVNVIFLFIFYFSHCIVLCNEILQIYITAPDCTWTKRKSRIAKYFWCCRENERLPQKFCHIITDSKYVIFAFETNTGTK